MRILIKLASITLDDIRTDTGNKITRSLLKLLFFLFSAFNNIFTYNKDFSLFTQDDTKI